MNKFLTVKSKLEGQGEFVVQNTMPVSSGAYGFSVSGTLEVANLIEGETFKLIANGREVLNVESNGKYRVGFTTSPRTFSEVVNLAYEGTADVILDLNA
ncbi:hypothetical protein [Priestia megaterium]|uniref:hypothetical protein n=1 Tax=Priestia megaterium TaxID=1404 RepID=UPI000BF2F9E8|nr:hypothetical protein [Priestia megaterium]PFJ00310.1 hypothetical protein COI84_08875 [Priestia megaterium]PGR16736.1 hypothetical protein COC62_00185 [Priestia megaterium]